MTSALLCKCHCFGYCNSILLICFHRLHFQLLFLPFEISIEEHHQARSHERPCNRFRKAYTGIAGKRNQGKGCRYFHRHFDSAGNNRSPAVAQSLQSVSIDKQDSQDEIEDTADAGIISRQRYNFRLLCIDKEADEEVNAGKG